MRISKSNKKEIKDKEKVTFSGIGVGLGSEVREGEGIGTVYENQEENSIALILSKNKRFFQ
jgi:hypothetical protein